MTPTDTRSADRQAPLVLLVEDQERTAQGLGQLLELEGFRVAVATDGPTGISLAADSPIDAVVLDVILPGMSGFDVCRRLRALDRTRRVPIVMLTGLSDTRSKIQGLDIGADDYLVKPVPARELAARLRKLISGRREHDHQVQHHRVQAIGEIAAAVAHEVNNPLAAALGNLDLTLMRHDLGTDVRRNLEATRQELWRIATVLSQLSDVRDRTMPYVGPDRMIVLGPGGNA